MPRIEIKTIPAVQAEVEERVITEQKKEKKVTKKPKKAEKPAEE